LYVALYRTSAITRHGLDPPPPHPTPNPPTPPTNQTNQNAIQIKSQKNHKKITKNLQKQNKKNTIFFIKKDFKKWDPLLDALIPEQFKFLQSDQ
jgi:hypothetical protein